MDGATATAAKLPAWIRFCFEIIFKIFKKYVLEYLLHVDQLLVKQQIELLEAFTGFETANKYKVLNSMGQQVFFAAEKNDCCTRQCCGPLREFEMALTG